MGDDVTGVSTVILCGGRGTRISEVDATIPKPLLPIGGRPILWHIMQTYSAHGFDDFVLALGWQGESIRRWLLDFRALTGDVTIDLANGELTHHDEPDVNWRVTCLDTGRDALTGTRVRRAVQRLDDGPVLVTYGDCVGDVDVAELLAFHRSHGKLATVTAVHPPGRFGELELAGDGTVTRFAEKPQTSSGAINGGFMVFEREAIERYIPEDADVMLEREPMAALAAAGQLVARPHEGFWQPMDTPREREILEGLWSAGAAPWTKGWP